MFTVTELLFCLCSWTLWFGHLRLHPFGAYTNTQNNMTTLCHKFNVLDGEVDLPHNFFLRIMSTVAHKVETKCFYVK